MSPRRIALGLVVTIMASTGSFSLTAARASSSTICVALVVDGRSIGSDVSTSCATVSKGATGIDVLQAAGHRVGFRNDGLLCTIDGLPKNGCAGVDDSHYWAYFHRAPGKTSWTYSSEGASTYQPVNDSTEGWVYDNGSALTPENVPYRQICQPKATPTPSPTLPLHTPKPAATRTHRPAKAHRLVTGSATPTATATATATLAKPKVHHHRPRHVSPGRSASSSPAPLPSTTRAALVGGSKPPSNSHGALDLIIGLVIVAGLGGLAARRFRRTPR